MKKKIVGCLAALAVCGTLVASVAPTSAQASTNGYSHVHDFESMGTVDYYSYVNPFDHQHWGYDLWVCKYCNAELHENSFSRTEKHDMVWVDYNTGLLRCVGYNNGCGYEEYFR